VCFPTGKIAYFASDLMMIIRIFLSNDKREDTKM